MISARVTLKMVESHVDEPFPDFIGGRKQRCSSTESFVSIASRSNSSVCKPSSGAAMEMTSEKREVERYIQAHDLESILNEVARHLCMYYSWWELLK